MLRFQIRQKLGRKSIWRTYAVRVLAVVALAILVRNPLADAVIEYVGSMVTGNSVTVGKIQIGFSQIAIDNLQVRESSLAGVPQVTVRSIRVVPSIWRGLRQGVWVESIVVEEPVLHVRFDEQGQLLSQFPSSSGDSDPEPQPLQLPFEQVTVTDAAVVIHQAGKEACSIGGASLTATVDASIHVEAEIAELLGTRLHVESCVDKGTLGGRTTLTLAPLELDSQRLAQIPMVPATLADHPVHGTLSVHMQAEHPANDLDLRNHSVDLQVKLADIDSAELGPISQGIDLRASQKAGLALLTIAGPIFDGQLQVDARSNLAADVPTAVLACKLSATQIGPLIRRFVPDAAVAVAASLDGTAEASWKDEVLSFHGQLAPSLTGIRAENVSTGDVLTKLECHGSFAPTREQPLAGTLTFATSSEGIDLQALTHQLGAKTVLGNVRFHGAGTIPLATVADVGTYLAIANVETTTISCEGIQLEPFALEARVENGNLGVTLPQAVVSVQRPFDRPADCLVNQLQLADTLRVESQLNFSSPIMWLHRPEAWTAVANLDVRGLSIAQETISDFATSCHLTGGVVGLSPCSIRWRDTTCNIVASGDLRDQAFATVQFSAEPISLWQVGDLASRFSARPLHLAGTARAAGSVHVDLRTSSFTAGGDLTLANATYGKTSIGNAQLTWSADPQAARLQSGSEDFFGGSYAVEAKLQSMDWTQTAVVASCREIQLARLASMSGKNLPVTGTLDARLSVSSIADLNTLQADGWLTTRGASFKEAPIQVAAARLNVNKGLATATVRGTALDAAFNVDASSQLGQLAAWLQNENRQLERVPVFGQVRVDGVGVKSAMDVASGTRNSLPLDGSVSVSCVRDGTSVDHGLLASMVCSAENLRWNRAVVARRIVANSTFSPTQFRLTRLDGNLADGTLAGDADLRIAQTPTGTFRLSLDNVNLRRAAAPIPGMAGKVSGAMSVSVFGRVGSVTSAAVNIRASNIAVGDLVVREIRMPVDCSLQMQSSQVHWNCRGGAIKLGGGNVVVNSEGALKNGRASMSSSVTLQNVDTARLLRGNSINAGVIDGTVKLQANRAQRPEDLVGQFHIELSRIKSLEIPGTETFTQLIKMPTLSLPDASQEDGGTLDGRLAGGLLHIDSLSLAKSGTLVLMDGTSTLDGRLDFNVVAFTSQSGPADELLSFADSPLMLAVSAPVAVVAKVNEAIKDRVIHVHVGGTSARPTIRLQPAKTLSQDVLRFFVAGTLGSPVANIATSPKRKTIR